MKRQTAALFIKMADSRQEQLCRSNHKSSALGLVSLRDLLNIQMNVVGSQSSVQGQVSLGVSI